MTVSSELSGAAWAASLPPSLREGLANLERAYFRHVDADDVDSEVTGVSQIFRRHLELAARRVAGSPLIRVHHPEDGSGVGAAVQVVTDDMPLLVDSITAAVSRAEARIIDVIHPIFEVERDADGRLLAAAAHEVDRRSAASGRRESWIHVQLDPATGPAKLDRLADTLGNVIADVRRVIDDRGAMERAQSALADELERRAEAGRGPYPPEESRETAALLRWLADGYFSVLGYARYRLRDAGDHSVSDLLDETCLGVLRPGVGTDFKVPADGPDRPLLRLTQGLVTATVHRPVYPYFVGVADVDATGEVVGEHLFIGVFTVTAVHENVLDIPVVRKRVRSAIERSGFELESYSGQAMLEVIQSFPRTELFSSDAETMRRTAEAVLNVGLRRQVRLFLRADTHGRFVACLVYLPRDRYTTHVRLTMQDILVRELGGEGIDYSARVSESDLASVYFTVKMPGAESGGPDRAAILARTSDDNRRRVESLLSAASRTWADNLIDLARSSAPTLDPGVVQAYSTAFPESYKQDFAPGRALRDIARLQRLREGEIDQHLYRQPDAAPGAWRFSLSVCGEAISLSQVLPVLQSLGVEVVDERPYQVRVEPQRWIYDFGVLARPDLLRGALDHDLDAELLETGESSGLRQRFVDAVEAMWHGRAEADGLNELVLRARLPWRSVAVLRTYAKYLQQAGFPYSQTNIARVLQAHPHIAALLVELFAARFDPEGCSAERATECLAELGRRIDQVVSLDADRILRAMLGLIKATLRTNFYTTDADGAVREHISVKLEPREIAELPKPKPRFEIFVYSPRVEGVHLRFGAVARGGLRWSDRLEDFRTEVLGLVKAQAVKNAVIVPVGAKGGFVVKKPPQATGDAAADRQALTAEGVRCYRTFISGLLDLTDNVDLATGAVAPAPGVVRHDGDDTYLVVAADKGTASFSDIANEVALDYGFWLGDAFASGGSAG
ncbi:MAG TPA: NAD-glutamate dehydrogenase domain-containing protein, partial [Nocardia sp.]|uniref:NAD-glutamate dehydrogenase domain-containing protein n=1 Tax=Nocardia sp. TaxID=1821 RepID=UPI002B4AD264